MRCCGPSSGSVPACACAYSGGYVSCDTCGGNGVVCDHDAHCPECGRGCSDKDLKDYGQCYTCQHVCTYCGKNEAVTEDSDGDAVCGECLYIVGERVAEQLEDL